MPRCGKIKNERLLGVAQAEGRDSPVSLFLLESGDIFLRKPLRN